MEHITHYPRPLQYIWYTVVPLLRGHPFRHRKVASQKGWPLKRGTFHCIFDFAAGKKLPLKRGWPLMIGASQEGDHCMWFCPFQVCIFHQLILNSSIKTQTKPKPHIQGIYLSYLIITQTAMSSLKLYTNMSQPYKQL